MRPPAYEEPTGGEVGSDGTPPGVLQAAILREALTHATTQTHTQTHRYTDTHTNRMHTM